MKERVPLLLILIALFSFAAYYEAREAHDHTHKIADKLGIHDEVWE
jgi:hypothetical protein